MSNSNIQIPKHQIVSLAKIKENLLAEINIGRGKWFFYKRLVHKSIDKVFKELEDELEDKWVSLSNVESALEESIDPEVLNDVSSDIDEVIRTLKETLKTIDTLNKNQ